MRVLIVNSLYRPHAAGGAEIITEEHAAALREAGIEVAVAAIGPAPGLVREEVAGVPVWRAGIRNIYFHHARHRPRPWQRMVWHLRDSYNPLMKPYLRRIIREFKPDVAACHVIAGWSIAAWDVLAEEGVPIVQVLHDQYLLCAKSSPFRNNAVCRGQCPACRLLRLPHRKKSNQVSAVVGVSRFILDKLVGQGYFQETPIRKFIHNARSFPFDPAAVAPRNDGRVVFGFIGRLTGNKGIELLLDTFSGTRAPEWRLVVAGTGDAAYESGLKERFTDPRIAFVGHCLPGDFFPQIDALAVPSLCEDTFPTVVFESLLFGVPVLGSAIGGIPEMVLPGENGVLFTPGEPEALLEAMQEMAGSLERFRGARDAIISGAARFKDRQAWTSEWLALYEQVISLQEGRPGAPS